MNGYNFTERVRKVLAMAREEAERLRKAVMQLPEDLRFTVTAHFWGGLPVKEIAEIERILPRDTSCFCNGVCSVVIDSRVFAICPNFVFLPVVVTTSVPFPLVMSVPAYTL